jgi:hypothetical protein
MASSSAPTHLCFLFDVAGVRSLARLLFAPTDEDGERPCDEHSVDDARHSVSDEQSVDHCDITWNKRFFLGG